MAAPAEDAARVLLVEGSDDAHVIRHLCEREGLPRSFSTVCKNGIDALLKSIPNHLNDIPDDHRRFAPNKSTRAKVHAWLAAQQRPRPMGLGITSGDLDPSDQTAQRFLSWIERLFNPTTSS